MLPNGESAPVLNQTGAGWSRTACAPTTERRLQGFGGEVGQSGAFAALERDVAGVGPHLEAVDRVGEAGRRFGQVRRVDLLDVTEADDLRARAGARDQCLHLLRRE